MAKTLPSLDRASGSLGKPGGSSRVNSTTRRAFSVVIGSSGCGNRVDVTIGEGEGVNVGIGVFVDAVVGVTLGRGVLVADLMTLGDSVSAVLSSICSTATVGCLLQADNANIASNRIPSHDLCMIFPFFLPYYNGNL